MPSSQTPSIAGTSIDPTAVRPPIEDAEIERIDRGTLRERLGSLRAQGVTMLLDVGAVDYLTREPRFDVVYHLLALPERVATQDEVATPRRIRLLVGVSADDPSVPSVTDLWSNANWAEREVFDLFGITFDGHPDLRRIQLPYDWEGHPLRKDYPVRGPERDRTPRPNFANKHNVPAGTPPSGKVAAALQAQIARGQAEDRAAIEPEEHKP